MDKTEVENEYRVKRETANQYKRNKRAENPDYDKPKDPEYFKNYYINKIRGHKYYCEYCRIDVEQASKAKHERTEKHIRNEILFNLCGQSSKYNVDDFVNERIICFKNYCKTCNKYSTKFSIHTNSEIHNLREKLNNYDSNEPKY